MRTIELNNTSKRDFHQFMLGGVTPRPIALVSTIDASGIRNLAPYSYFNAVSSIPPILMVSVGRKPDGNKKDTLVNVENNREFVVNMVPYSLIMQMALSSVALPPDADEFDLSGLTPVDSVNIAPYRVKESPIQFECRLRELKEMGKKAGESTLLFGDVLCIHVDEKIIDKNNRIDPVKANIVGRLGRSYYSRVEASNIETIVMPQMDVPIGYSYLPEDLRNSTVLTANDIAKMAALKNMPDVETIQRKANQYSQRIISYKKNQFHKELKKMIEKDDIENALIHALIYDKMK